MGLHQVQMLSLQYITLGFSWCMLLFHQIAKDMNKSLNTKSLEIKRCQDNNCPSISGAQAALQSPPACPEACSQSWAGFGTQQVKSVGKTLSRICSWNVQWRFKSNLTLAEVFLILRFLSNKHGTNTFVCSVCWTFFTLTPKSKYIIFRFEWNLSYSETDCCKLATV